MPLNPVNINYSWNFTKPDKAGYSEQLIGTIVSIQEIQAREYKRQGGVGKPRVWDNGDPVMNIRMGFAIADGSFKTMVFAEAGKEQVAGNKPSIHVQLWDLVNRSNFENLIGKTVQITTWPANPTTGQAWGLGNPRLFDVQEVPGISYKLNYDIPHEYLVPKLLANDGANGGQPVQPTPPSPVTMTTPAVPVNVPQANVLSQPQVPVNVPVANATAQTTVATTAAMPQGIDPTVAAAMTAAGAVNVQPMTNEEELYSDIPF